MKNFDKKAYLIERYEIDRDLIESHTGEALEEYLDPEYPYPMNGDKNDPKVVTGYMCLTDWDYEIGAAADGDIVYPSIRSLKEDRSCVNSCGIVEVKVMAVKVIQEPDYGDLRKYGE
jgi:hypothetical protein